MEIVIDLTSFLNEFSGPPWVVAWKFFLKGGWAFFVFLFLLMAYYQWINYIRGKYTSQWKHIILAIDIPKDHEQTPKAVEHIFTHLAGIETTPTLYQKYFQGKIQEYFSVELVSIDGHIQFLIWTEESFRDLVEAAIFAQYPEAEITEVEDYTQKAPTQFPSDEYEMFGAEFKLFNHEAYPIRVYTQFEHALDQTYKDPMAALLEILSRLKQGEQLWLQFVITPVGGDWRAAGNNLINKLIGKSSSGGGRMPTSFLQEFVRWWEELASQIFGFLKGGGGAAASGDLPSLMQYLTPGEVKAIEAIQQKLSKIAFKTKFRMIYLAKRDAYNPAKGVDAVIGAILQFNTQDMNGFAPYKPLFTKTHYLRAKQRLQKRRTKLIRHYMNRNNYQGAGKGFILNIEELASVWHFPVPQVKAPLVQKTEARKGEPPTSLPLFEETEAAKIAPTTPPRPTAGPPNNLPVI